MKIAIQQGRVICPTRKIDEKLDIYIAEGKILALGSKPANFKADTIIDAHSYIISPGFIDLFSHLGEWSHTTQPNIFTETKAAANSGFTTVTIQSNFDNHIDSPAMLEFIKSQEKLANNVKIVPIGAMTQHLQGQQLTEYGTLKRHGCSIISAGTTPMHNTHLLRLCFEYAVTYDLTVFITPKDPWLSPLGAIHEGEISTRLGLPHSPACTEEISLARYLALAELTQVKLHFNKISTAKGVNLIRRAKQQGLKITASVALAHLRFTNKNLADFNVAFHFDPPLREENDRLALLKGLADGTLDVLVSDHCPSTQDDKHQPFAEASLGMVSYPTFLPSLLSLQNEDCTLINILEKLTTQPSKILNLQNSIAIDKGIAANLCIFSEDKLWQLTPSHLSHPQLYCPFYGQMFKGLVIYTIKDGRIIANNSDEFN